MSDTKELLPLARTDALVIKELEDEVLVYDLQRHKAHCLNPTAASVWKRCDGKFAVTEMAHLLEKELKTPVKDEIVWLALQQLDKFHLLQQRGTVSSGGLGLSRRDLVRRIGISAALLPAIISITAPPAAQAQTCVADGKDCLTDGQCCSGRCRSFCQPAQNCLG